MFRFFKCNKLGGFRLSDLSRKIHTDEYFYIDKYVCDTSRSVKAALNAKWMLEVTEEEAAKHNSVVKTPDIHRKDKIDVPKAHLSKTAINAKETNKRLESRQVSRSIKQPMQKQKEEDKVIVPNFVEADKKIKDRQADITTTGRDEILKSPVQSRTIEVSKKQAKVEAVEVLKSLDKSKLVESQKITEKVEEILKDEVKDNIIENKNNIQDEKDLESTSKKVEFLVEISEVDSKDFVNNLAKDIGADNSQMSAPNFDEKKQEVKQEIKQQVEKRIRRRKKQDNQDI